MNCNIHVINNDDDLMNFQNNRAKFTKGTQDIPLFPISNVSGTGIATIQKFLMSLDKYIPYGEYEGGDVNFFIANTYNVPGIGIVVSGIMKSGSVKKGDVLYLGPNANGYLRDVNTNTIIGPSGINNDVMNKIKSIILYSKILCFIFLRKLETTLS